MLFCMGLKAWCFTLGEEHTPKLFDSRVLRKIFGCKRDVLKGGSGKDYIMRSCMPCTPHQILFRWSNQEFCQSFSQSVCFPCI